MAARFEWVDGTFPPADLRVTQVYVFCFDDVGRVLLLKDGSHFGIPGGKPEIGETFRQTAEREVLEEASVSVVDIRPLGYQLVYDPQSAESTYAQLRVAARIAAVHEAATDPGTGKTFERILVPPADAAGLIGWGDEGVAQANAAASTAAQAWRIQWRDDKRAPREVRLG